MEKQRTKPKKYFRAHFKRRLFVFFLLLLQLALIFFFIFTSSIYSDIIFYSLYGFSILVSIYILTRKDAPAFKITWIFIVIVLPLFGSLFYFLFKVQSSPKKLKRLVKDIDSRYRKYYTNEKCVLPEIDEAYIRDANYLEKFCGFPVYDDSSAEYFPTGEHYYAALLEELEKAEKYIFIEIFIIQEGKMWNSILEILKRKVAEGVDVRVMYDDMGCIFTLPINYRKKLRALGIKCTVFSPFIPIFTALQNNRDHRKLIIIDGKVGFTGGVNLADEYINEYEKHGKWKDSGIILKGNAVWSMTVMFLEIWNVLNRTKENISVYKALQSDDKANCGYIAPYCDNPIDDERVGEEVYLKIIGSAKKYLYISTPYLILDEQLNSALMLAAKGGVDVRIITPHIADKRLVHITTRSFYPDLIRAGVKIYEYTDGFNHSKVFIADDRIATVGTINLDFRSLYLHYENGVWLLDAPCLKNIKQDFIDLIPLCQEIKSEDFKNGFFAHIWQELLRIFSPIM